MDAKAELIKIIDSADDEELQRIIEKILLFFEESE